MGIRITAAKATRRKDFTCDDVALNMVLKSKDLHIIYYQESFQTSEGGFGWIARVAATNFKNTIDITAIEPNIIECFKLDGVELNDDLNYEINKMYFDSTSDVTKYKALTEQRIKDIINEVDSLSEEEHKFRKAFNSLHP